MQGFNMGRYVPPEYEGQLSANQVSRKRSFGAPDRHGSQSTLKIRFEMPFAIWCTTCPKPTLIDQGVRFNAAKIKAGGYYSTPIWMFRMRHSECGGQIELITDPQNPEYVILSGGKRREEGHDKFRDSHVEIVSGKEVMQLKRDAFAALEVKINDRKQQDAAQAELNDLYRASSRDWNDPFAANKRLRKSFRTERKELENRAATSKELKTKMSLGFELLCESDEDKNQAITMTFDQQGVPVSGTLVQGTHPHASKSVTDFAHYGSPAHVNRKFDQFERQGKHYASAIPGVKGRIERSDNTCSGSSRPKDRDKDLGPLALVSYESDEH